MESEKNRWLFFDVGSTLVDETFAYEFIFKSIADQIGKTYEEILAEAEDLYRQNKKGNLELEKKYKIQHIKWPLEKETLYLGASSVLSNLKTKYKIGIIANQALGTKERLEKWGLLKDIDLVVASAEEGYSKPDIRLFRVALERACCEPEAAFMIGDRIDNDIAPAKLLGMHTIWVKQGFGGYWTITSEQEASEYEVNRIDDVCDILL